MTNNVSCFVENIPRELLTAEVERNGTRAIDTGVFMFPRNVPIDKGDNISYMQDPVNIRYLAGIWNFDHNTRDESGYNNDGDEGSDETTATNTDGCNGRVIYFAGSGKGVKIPNDSSHMKFDGQFDIIIWFANTSASNNGGCLFSKGDSTNYIKILALDTSSSVQRLKATVKIGGTTTDFLGTNVNTNTSGQKTQKQYHYVRLKRDGNNLITFSVDNITEGTPTKMEGDIVSSSPLYIDEDVLDVGIQIPKAKLAQVRLYSGGFLSDEDFASLRQARRQPNTMKFGGKVWKIDEQPTHKIAHCKGMAKILHDLEVNTGKTNGSHVTWTTGDSDIYKNIYYDKNGEEIVTDILKAWNTGIKVVDVDGNIDNNDYDEYAAVGTLYQNIVVLTLNGSNDSSFSIGSRGILLLENNDIDYHTGLELGLTDTDHNDDKFSSITFKQGNIKVTSLGKDDSTTVTLATGITRIPVKENVTVGTHSGNTPNFTDGYTTLRAGTARKPMAPAAVKVTYSDGTILTNKVYGTAPANNEEFTVGFEPSGTSGYTTIILGAAAETTGTYTVEYQYEDITNRNHFYTHRDSNADTLGDISKRIFIPQITNSTGAVNLTNFLARFTGRFSGLNRRFTIRVPTLVNYIRENYKINVIDEDHGQTTKLALPVKSVKFYYPQGTTVIDCGEHFLDAYDLDNALGVAVHELRSGITTSEPV